MRGGEPEYDSIQAEDLSDDDDIDENDAEMAPRTLPTTRRSATRRRHSSVSYDCGGRQLMLIVLVAMMGGAALYRVVVEPALISQQQQQQQPKGTTITSSSSQQHASIYQKVTTATSSSDTSKRSYTIHYDPTVGQPAEPNALLDHGALPLPPPPPLATSNTNTLPRRGYLQQPSIYNNSLVFLSEGDLYYTHIAADSSLLVAMKLTTTIGNVLWPKIHKDTIVYTATYSGRRDVYRMDLATLITERVTFTATSGIRNIAQAFENSILYAAPSSRVSLPDTRLFQRNLLDGTDKEVPLSQAVDGVVLDDCLYFVRYKQSSRTARYVGGTAESLWKYCSDDDVAVPLTQDYNGTSKSPSIAKYHDKLYLLFLSDRSAVDGGGDQEWKPASMEVWAMELPTDATGSETTGKKPIQVTHVACQFHGMAVQEYSVDPVTNNVVVRVGADLHMVPLKRMERRLEGKTDTVEVDTLVIQVYSDFHEQQERQLLVNPVEHLVSADVFETAFGTTNLLATLRGQTWVLPVLDAVPSLNYQGSGQNLPPRRYRVVPGSMTGGFIRVLKSVNVPLLTDDSPRRLAVILATDPLSSTAEHAFYLVETHSDAVNTFVDMEHLPEPFLGGRKHGGSTKDGGLGSVAGMSLTVSPCGRRMAWTDKDGRILVMTLPIYQPNATYTQLNTDNELGEPMDGSNSNLLWSPGGRYLAVEHQARNQFSIITIVDCGDPGDDKQMNDISLGRHVQATPNRFNSYRMAWGKSSIDYYLRDKLEMVAMLTGNDPPDDVATTLYFLTDRDVVTDVGSPWGNRAPAPHFSAQRSVWALPLIPVMAEGEVLEPFLGRFAGGGALELFIDDLGAFKRFVDEIANAVEAAGKGEGDERRRRARYLRAQTDDLVRQLRSRKLKASEAASLHRFLMLAMDETGRGTKESKTYSNVKDMGKRRVRLTSQNGKPTTSANVSQVSILSVTSPTDFPVDENSSLDATESKFPKDMSIDFGKADLSFARKAYRMSHIPKAVYIAVASQTNDDGSLVLVELAGGGVTLKLFSPSTFPSDKVDAIPISVAIDNFGLSTDRNHAWVVLTPDGKTKVIENTVSGWSSLPDEEKNVADASQLGISIFPSQEYQQMFNDAWRLLRDYFYDYKMHGVDWPSIHERYRDLVERCTKREELDDVLAQMASELSALHVFVYGGEYNSPIDEEDQDSFLMVTPGNLGVSLTRDPHWKGYRVSEIPNQDPDFNLMDDYPTFCPLCDQTLRLSGQKGLEVGDVIVAINGDSVMQVPDIHMLLRGTIGRSVRLEVLRLSSGAGNNTVQAKTESIITSPISPSDAASLFYNAWEWKTRETAKRLAAKAGFSVAYIHMKSMLQDDENAFARGFFPDYDAQALILDVRHNNGGNIDSWILTMLQRKAWMYWQGRTGMRRGDSDWDEQFAFRGHIVVLIDEMTASDGEGVSRGISELGLGRLIGTRTWGGGIWLASDNQLVDGGIATAPEIGTFNDNFGWGLGIEQHGVVPDIEVDNNPRTSFDGKDTQLETAIKVLEKWLVEEPVVIPNPPKNTMDMSVHGDSCRA